MPVEVKKASNNTATHEDSASINVVDGHLYVSKGSATIAIYAPGTWRSAEVVKVKPAS